MQWSEEAIILATRKFGESGLLLTFFARSKGLYSGLVRGGQSKSKTAIYQVGNLVEATWRGRLEEQLGVFTAEAVNSIGAKLISEPLKLQALISINSIMRKTLIDSQPYVDLYITFKSFLEHLLDDERWEEGYVKMEMLLMQYLGFGLDLTECAVSGATVGLAYISPKTGRAVTAEVARGYEDKLFKLPRFLLDELANETEIIEALKISEYFLEKHLFYPHGRKLPEERGRFVGSLVKLILSKKVLTLVS